MQAIRERLRAGDLGSVFAADLTFHNAYGPQSGWFWDPKLSGGGCLIDLGVHLVDLALWLFDFPDVTGARATLLRDGRPVRADEVEDYASGEFTLANGVVVRIACSWNLDAGRDAVIEANLYGTAGGARMFNENGSFFNFAAEMLKGRDAHRLTSPADDWGGGAAAGWVKKLSAGGRFAGSTHGLLHAAASLDPLYAADAGGARRVSAAELWWRRVGAPRARVMCGAVRVRWRSATAGFPSARAATWRRRRCLRGCSRR